jgi:glutathione S-transferase
MSIVFYYSPMSSATRVHWALEELGVPYEKKKLDLAAGDQTKPAYLALNPNGKVPLLVDDGTVIFESLAILLHLGERYGVDKGLFPGPGAERTEAFKWLAWGGVTMTEAMVRLLRNSSDRFPAEEQNPKTAEGAKREIAALLKILDHHLEGKETILGGAFSLVDLALAAAMPFMARIGVDFQPYARVNAWVSRCTTRPALGRAMMG